MRNRTAIVSTTSHGVKQKKAKIGGASVGAWQAEADEEDFEDCARVERAAPLEVEVGFQENGRELIDAMRAEVGMLLAGLVDGVSVHAGDAAGLGEIETGDPEAAGVMGF